MDDPENDFDSVQWTRDGASPQSPPTKSKSNGKRRQSSHADSRPPTDNIGDAVDNAGIGKDGYLDCNVDKPLKESEGTKDVYVSYLVTTHVRIS